MYKKTYFNQPFVQFTIPIIIGIVFYYYVKIDFKFIAIGLIVSLVLFLICFFFNKRELLILYFLFFIIGMLTIHEKTENSILLPFVGENVEIKGRIVEAKYKDDFANYIVESQNIYYNDSVYTGKEKVLLKCYGEGKYETGDIISFSGILNEPRPNTNPKLFNYKLYLETNDIFTIISTRSHFVKVLSKNNLSLGENLRKKFKTKVESTFDEYLNLKNSQLMKSVMLGEISYLDEEYQIKYREMGLAHLMAVSGLHIGIISSFLISALAILGVNRKVNVGMTIAILWIYGYLIGFPPSVLRSLIMFTVLMYSQVQFRSYDEINTIAFAAFVLLIYNPLWLFNVGFQLSFMATLSLLLFLKEMRNKFYPYKGKAMTSLYSILAVQIGIAPITIYYFNSISPISILANFLLIPLLSIGVIIAFLILLFSFVSSFVCYFLGLVLNGILNVENIILNMIYVLPFGSVKMLSPSVLEMFLYYFAVFCIFNIVRVDVFPFKINRVIFYYLIVCILFTAILPVVERNLTIEFIDVGQGDCMLIETDGRYFLLDTGGNAFGNFDVGENIVLPYLVKKGVFSLDGVFITHFHEDHCKSLPMLMENLKVKRVFIAYENEDSRIYNDIISSAKENKVHVYKIGYNQKLDIGQNVSIRVLWPKEETHLKHIDNENNLSLVLLLNSFDKKILFTGDIEIEIESILVQGEKEDIDFLKVPHHGSSTSSSEDFIDFFSPKYGFIQVGKNNFGHPNEEVLERYKDRGIDIYRTDESGLITLDIRPNEYDIHTFIREKPAINDIILNYGLEISFVLIYMLLSYYISKKNCHIFREWEDYEI